MYRVRLYMKGSAFSQHKSLYLYWLKAHHVICPLRLVAPSRQKNN